MIGLAINNGSFFIWGNPNGTPFTPDFEFTFGNFDLRYFHLVTPKAAYH
jgi:hypothetical protein